MAKIVLCDDSQTILKLFDRKLRACGHEILGMAKDGDESIKLYFEKKPDVLLLDITMPNKDGRECLAAILKLDPKAKIIMVSAIQDKDVVKECLNHGAKAFISKGHLYDDKEFEDKVLQIISNVAKAA